MFLNLIMLAGVAAAGIPLAIHLINRGRPRTVQWGAMHLLEGVLKQSRRRLRLERLLLLLLRTIIPILLALAMARPVLSGFSALIGNARASLLVCLDDSFSMQAGDGVTSNLSRAKEQLDGILGALPRGSEVAINAGSGRPGVGVRLGSTEDAHRRLNEFQPGFSTFDPAGVLVQAASTVQEMHEAERSLVIASDFQAQDWGPDGRQARDRALAALRTQTGSLDVVLLRTAKPMPDNIAVETIELSRQMVGVNQPVRIRAGVVNHGNEDRNDLRLFFRVDGKERAVSQLSIPAHQRGQVLFEHTFDTPGSHVIEVEAQADALDIDNTIRMSVPVVEQVPVLLVSGGLESRDGLSGTGYLELALRPYAAAHATTADLIALRRVREDALTAEDLQGVRVVVLANVRQLDQVGEQALVNFVHDGGGLLVFPGDRVNAAWYDARLGDILPASFSGIGGGRGTPASAVTLARPNHPAVSALAETGIAGIAVRNWQRLASPPDAGESNVLARLDNGEPFLVIDDGADGRGRVGLCAVPVDDSWSNLPLRTAFLPLVQGLVVHLAATVNPPRNLTSGDHILSFQPAQAVGRWAVITDPTGKDHRVQVSARSGGDGGMIDFVETARPGIYVLTTANDERIHYAVSAPVAESNLSLLDDSGVQALADELGATVVDSWQAWRDRDQQRRHGRELWPLLAGLVLFLLFAELWLQSRFARTGT